MIRGTTGTALAVAAMLISTPSISIADQGSNANAHLAQYDLTGAMVPSTMTLTIETYMSGFHLATSTIDMVRKNGRYVMATQTNTQGFLDTFVKADFRTSAKGIWSSQGIAPEQYVSEGESNWGKFASEIQYDGLVPRIVQLDAEVNEPEEGDEWLEVPENLRLGTFDPLTASLTSTLLANADQDKPCGTNVAVYNGWSRMDFSATSLGMDELTPDRERFYAGPAHKCQLKFERIAGGRKNSVEEEEKDPTPPGTLWIADFNGTSIPVRFQLDARLGYMVAHVVDVTIDGAKLAMVE